MTASTGSAPAPEQAEAGDRLGWDGVVAIFILLVAATSLRNWLLDRSLSAEFFRVVWMLLYLATTARLLQRFGTQWLTWTIRHQPALCVLLALSVVSCLWSLAPVVTLQKVASLFGTTVLGVFIGYSCPPRRLMRVLFWTFTLLLAMSVFAYVVLPEPPPARVLGWRGIMAHKNSFGAVAALATVFFLVSAQRRAVHPVSGTLLCAFSLFAVMQSNSRTSVAALALTLLVYLYLGIASLKRRPTRVVLRRVAVVLVLIVAILPFLIATPSTTTGPTAALSNDYALNGRPVIWDGALTILRERPLTGYGYAVVWGLSRDTLLPHIPITAHRSAANAHNSIANVATQLGIPAALVACVLLFTLLADASELYERDPSAFSTFALLFMFTMTVMGFAEAHVLQIHSIFWILVVAVAVTVQRALQQPVNP